MTDYDMIAVLPDRRTRPLLSAEKEMIVRYYHHYKGLVARITTEMGLSQKVVIAVLGESGIDPDKTYKRPALKKLNPGFKALSDAHRQAILEDLVVGVCRSEIVKKHGISTPTVTKLKREHYDYLQERKDALAAELYKELGSCRRVARAMHECERKTGRRIDRIGVERVKERNAPLEGGQDI